MRRTLFFLLVSSLCGITSFTQTSGIKSKGEQQHLLPAAGFTSSNLPIFIINTNNQQIPDEPKITAHLGIIYNGPGQRNNITDAPNHYDGFIGIELRGNSTQNYPKKPYAFETRDDLGENLNVSLLGMPEDNDWVLRASYFDHTFIRNNLACHMSRLTGRWASRCQHVELVLNGEYQGIYILMEKIKRGHGRLDIARLDPDDVTLPDITGGYIYEITGFENNLGESRYLRYPDYDDAASEQKAYIRQYDDEFRSIMRSGNYADRVAGYSSRIDPASFIDELIVQEAMRNSDAYGWSGYFHKDRDSRIEAGPVWDFDQSAGNSSYPDDGVIDGWMFDHPNTNNTPYFWSLLFKDPLFSYGVKQRWQTLRQEFYKTSVLMAYIDSIAGLLSEAQFREFEKWPVPGQFIWRETSGYEQRTTYQLEVSYLKNFLLQRWIWMDNYLAKIADPTSITAYPVKVFNDILVYPNPATDHIIFTITANSHTVVTVRIYNNLGAEVQHSDPYNISEGSNSLILPLNVTEQPGIYLYRIFAGDETAYTGRFVRIK